MRPPQAAERDFWRSSRLAGDTDFRGGLSASVARPNSAVDAYTLMPPNSDVQRRRKGRLESQCLPLGLSLIHISEPTRPY